MIAVRPWNDNDPESPAIAGRAPDATLPRRNRAGRPAVHGGADDRLRAAADPYR